jgi:CRISPR-associated protein Cmr3
MYNDSTPNDGQTSSSRGNLVPVTKSSPCPHCGKPDWCYSIGELTACNRDQPPAPGWEATSKTDKDGKIYYGPIQQKKAIRPRQTRYWEYPARDGSPLVRVVRFDDGEGGKPDWHQERWGKCKPTRQIGWVVGTKDIPRENIPIYRYAEARKAIANNELIFIAEGEDNVDRLWALGLAATCNIGGSGKWRKSDTKDLEGAKVVIITDRDEPGVKHAELLHEEFPNPFWLYPFPNSKAWENLPKSKGLDIADWIEHHQITADDIKAAIGEKKVFNAPAPTSQAAAKVLTHERFKSPSVDLRKEITALFNADIRGSELTTTFVELARGSNSNVQQVERIYKEIQEETDRDEQRLDRKSDLEELLKISSRRLTLEKYLHPNLAEPIKKVSTWMGVDPEAVLTHLLPIAAGLINPNSRIVVKECTNFVEPCLLYSAVIAETGSRKTPLLNIPKAPLVKLQAEEDARYKAELEAYKKEFDAYNNRPKENKDDEPPVPPHPPREFYVDNVTVESLDEIKGCQPDKAFTMIKDELSGLFASHGAYKGGRGSDKESFLSGWGGGGVKKNRRSKDSRVSLARDSLSITGGIQPDKLRALFGDFTDAQGEWARFLWYQMPMRPYKIPRHGVTYSLGNLLESIYRKLDSLPELEFYFSKDGQNFYDDWYDKKYEQTRNETKPGLKAAMAKMPGQAARLIGVLHVLNGVSNQPAEVQEEISLTTVRAGCHLAQFYLGQVTILQGDGDALHGELTPILKSLLEKVNDKGELNATQAKSAVWGLRTSKPEEIRQYFNELAAMDLAEVQGTGSRLTLKSNLRNVEENLRNVEENLRNVEENLRNVEENLRDSQPPQVHIYQEVQEINFQTHDVIQAISLSDTDAVERSVDEFSDSEKTSSSSSFVEIEPENLLQQGTRGLEESSSFPSNSSSFSSSLEESSSFPSSLEDSSTKPSPVRKSTPRIFEIGDRVVIKDVGGRYQGTRGVITEIRPHSTHTGLMVKFDKEVAFSQQCEFIAGDLMYLAPGQ